MKRGNSVVEIQAHNLKVAGSIPAPAPNNGPIVDKTVPIHKPVMSWFRFVYSKRCAVCDAPVDWKPRRFWAVGLCVECQFSLPPRMLTHLQTAICGRWFKRWAWLSCQFLRTREK